MLKDIQNVLYETHYVLTKHRRIHSENCGVKITPPVLIEDHSHAFYTGVKFVVLIQHPVVLF